MPIRKQSSNGSQRSVKSATSTSKVTVSSATIRQHADALHRAAEECCRQHDRFARLLKQTVVDVEELAVDGVCKACDHSLAELARAYGDAAATARPSGDPSWWRKANALWLASREYVQRHAGCDAVTRKLSHHAPGDLTKLHAEFELEASALLALRHACEAYRHTNPDAA